jgi:hypothetical protein
LIFESKQDVREFLFDWEWHRKSDKGFHGLPLLMEATAAMKNRSQYLISKREL